MTSVCILMLSLEVFCSGRWVHWVVRNGDYYFLLDAFQGTYQLAALYFSVGKMFRMLMCIHELIIGEFEFDGLSPKPPNKNHGQYFHVYTISFIVCLSGLYQTLGLSVGCL